MGYVNVHTFVAILLPQADWWVLILGGLSAVAAFALRSRFGILMALLAGVFALAVIFDPQGSLYNVRFLPLWFLPVYLLAGWGIATAVTGAVDLWPWLAVRIVRLVNLLFGPATGPRGSVGASGPPTRPRSPGRRRSFRAVRCARCVAGRRRGRPPRGPRRGARGGGDPVRPAGFGA